MTLAELKARVEAATGPDRELDSRIFCALFAPPTAYVEQAKISGAWCIYNGTDKHGRPRLWDGSDHPYRHQGWEVTASLDAALALVEAKLPGMSAYLLDKAIRSATREGVAWHEGTPQRITLALLSALLSALEAQP